MKEISASLLSFMKEKDINKNVDILNKSSADYIHLDVMDNKFVNNEFLSKEQLKNILKKITKKVDIHFMVENPFDYIKEITSYNISYITIHYEIKNIYNVINNIKNLGFKVGLAIKPETKITEIENLLDKIDLVLIMSVNPGYAGQEFILDTKYKINKLKNIINKRNLSLKIEADGGINEKSLEFVENADILVLGTFIVDDLSNIDKAK